ncbi:MAG: hypothetical protein M3Q57_09765 [Pseudomonadota bacterium]|nr:hypothetical protein [Pseudomonadota bacterium]
MLLIFLLVSFVIFAAAVSTRLNADPPPDEQLPFRPLFDEREDPAELAERDPVEALLRHGTPDDAARLAEQGVDLEALGYRPPRRD